MSTGWLIVSFGASMFVLGWASCRIGQSVRSIRRARRVQRAMNSPFPNVRLAPDANDRSEWGGRHR